MVPALRHQTLREGGFERALLFMFKQAATPKILEITPQKQ